MDPANLGGAERDMGAPDGLLLVDVLEAARRIGIGRSELYVLLRSNRVRSVKIGRRRLVPVAELNRFVASLLSVGCDETA
jgi:excisionase family DNA binding protein